MSVEIAVDAGAAVGECPVWDQRTGLLYWVDVLAGTVHVHNPSSMADRPIAIGTHVGSLALRAAGGLVLAVADGFHTLDPSTSQTAPLSTVDHFDPPARFNDGVCDPTGRFWAGTMAYDLTPHAGVLYTLDVDHSLRPALTGVTVSNGLQFTADGHTLYYVDTPTQQVDVFDVEPETGTLSQRRTVVHIPAAAGSPDGLTLDAEGCLWVALWQGSAVHRYTPDGRLDRIVQLPVSKPTCPTFGGHALDTLYVTSASHCTDEPHAGALFAVDVSVQGLPPNTFAG